MDFKRLARGEWLAMAGGIVVIISLFLPAYRPDQGNPNVDMFPDKSGLQNEASYSVWQVHPYSRWILLLAALAPLILAYIIARDYELSWPRGQLTSVLAIYIIGFSVYWGFIDRPGEPSSAVGLGVGLFGILLGAILMLVGSFMRQAETEVKRKPPGTL